jgi:cyclic beta-1,2-glucan synthetase
LVMPAYENTLLYQTNKSTVKRQIEYAAQRGIPWGISESAYNAFDTSLNYQYKAFGVPGLGLKRGLQEDLVIAPYASMLALMVLPDKACQNLQLLAQNGFEGEYGFYEAIDYTSSRLPRGKKNVVIQSFMVHHQGMGFLSIAYLLLHRRMQQRFTAELRFQATLLLLQERIPRATVFYAHTAELIEKNTAGPLLPTRILTSANTPIPEIQLLSNGRYQIMITNGGGGYSRWKDISLNRWREDGVTDGYGTFCYIKDVDQDIFWSNTHQPTLVTPDHYEVLFSQGHVEFKRTDGSLETKTEIVISPEDDTEIRRIRISNKGTAAKVLEVTSYTEVVIASQASDEAHPAFSNLFVQTEIHPQHNALLGTRRPRSSDEQLPWFFHLMDVQGVAVETVSYETDRTLFIGRGNSLADPAAMHIKELSGSQGAVLDPVMAIRHRFTIKPNQAAIIDMVYGVSDTEETCKNNMHKYKDPHLRRRAIELSWTHNQVLLRQLNASEADVQLFNRLASSVVFNNTVLRADAAVINSNYRGQSGLWSHSISGDLPIVLLHVYDADNIELVKQMIQAHAYWRLKGLAVDLVIWNEDHGSYRQILQDEISGLINSENNIHTSYSKPGSIFVKSTDQISPEDRVLFESLARIIISDNKGTLTEQVDKIKTDKVLPPLFEKQVSNIANKEYNIAIPDNLLHFNGSGGFTADGKEYKIITGKNNITPAPWVNVIANPGFGTVISESAAAYTWAINAHEYRLTPWSNDPVNDSSGEAFYIRDEENGDVWSPAPFPVKSDATYITTHGFGYSVIEHSYQGLASEMSVFVDKALPMKFIVLKIKNHSGKDRKLSATGFMEFILGDVRSKTNMHILSEWDRTTGALLFRNRYNSAFAEQVSFFSVNGADVSFTTDRTEFIGRNNTLNHPKSLNNKKLSGRLGAGKDSCGALQVKFDLKEEAEFEVIFLLGSTSDSATALNHVNKFKNAEAVWQSLNDVKAYWNEMMDTVQINTPDTSLNILSNGWLLYQTIACRLFARTGFYQSGGAFGFRDQLQDVLALLHAAPALAKEQILLSASRQFEAGDVQHWWHPPEGRGVRTRCSDDLLWLPFVTSRYVAATGDIEMLHTTAGFLENRELHPGEDSLYDLSKVSNQSGTIYEHCVRSIKRSLHFGKHGLTLMGSGDWNDGMDKVGHLGKGESVWLAFFLYDVLMEFKKTAVNYGDDAFADTCNEEAEKLQANIEATAWDGEWYLRAWFDDGTPLGSSTNEECRIDAIAQSWSVLSNASSKERQVKAMASLNKYLVNRDLKLIKLLDPAFDKSNLSPGYIKGYVPGVRENGGQYSHAAIWSLIAFAKLGNRDKVYELFSMIQPLNHSMNKADRDIYKVEPYVMAADVYANESHKGRGGWTWYTGSAGWMYQFITGSLLGMERHGNSLRFKPCFPLEWPSVTIRYRFGTSLYLITVIQDALKETAIWQIGSEHGEGNTIALLDDGYEHTASINIPV